MNEFGLILLGAAARATALAVAGLVAMQIVRRRGPAAGALAGSTTLAVMFGVSALAVSPWPHWWSPGQGGATPRAAAVGTSVGVIAEEAPARTLATMPPPADPTPASGWSFFAEEFRRELAHPTPLAARGARRGWLAGVAWLFLAGWAVALVRLGLGLWAVRALRAESFALDDPGLLAQVAELSAALDLRREVAVRESREVATPATVGWRRPVVLLPPAWTTWTEGERRAVLAHELAHVARGDYLVGLVAQVSLSLHFYHPLAHALAGRLRLHQELAADARGAGLVGGRRPYLTTLANLALRQEPRPVAWPVRPFLPTRGTFLRRIEMLRNPKVLEQPPMPPQGRAATVAALLAAGLFVAGLRGPGATAQEPKPAEAKLTAVTIPDRPPLDPTSASSDVHFVLDLRPAELLKNPEFRKLAEQIPADGFREFKAIASGEIEQVLVLGFERPANDQRRQLALNQQVAFVLRSARPYDWKGFISAKVEEVMGDGFTYYRTGSRDNSICFRVLDERTLLAGMPSDIISPPIGVARPAGRHGWDEAWKKLSPGPVRMALDTPWLVRSIRPMGAGAESPLLRVVSPLLEKTQAYAMTLVVAEGLSLDALATSGTEGDAARVGDTLRALLTLARNSLPELRLGAERQRAQGGRPLTDLVDAIDAMLETAKVDQDKSASRLHARADAEAIATATRMLLPAMSASREASSRAVSVNNLKQIGLAMHNYHATYDCFPPAILYGPDGKTPYSWRVAILPFLEQLDLYKEYKFDEPWDGPNNIKLVERMPQLYHDPAATDARPGVTSYLAPAGPMTLITAEKAGVRLASVTDGTSNTIMVVEAKRDVPWTKPEDITIVQANLGDRPNLRGNEPVPAFGGFHPGGFDALFGDGSVRFLKESINPILVRALLTRNGGEVISADAY